MTVLKVTKVLMGGKVIPKQSKPAQLPKAYFVRQLIPKLNAALTRDARLLEKLHARKAIDTKLQGLIESFTKHVISVVDSFPINGERIPAIFFKKVQLLRSIQERFKVDSQKIISKSDTHSRRIEFATKWLAEDVRVFASQVEMVYSSIPVFFDSNTGELLPPSIRNIPNRHRDPNKERIFLDAIKKYQDVKKGKKFMSYKFIEPLMEAAGLKFPERTFRSFKTDFNQGKFRKLVR